MKRMIALELKRITSSRFTRILVGIALLLTIALSFSAISYEDYYFLNTDGSETSISGVKAIQAKKDMYQSIEGEISPEKIKAAFENYHQVYNTYGKEIPKDVYFKKVYPILPILERVGEVYIDKTTGGNQPFHKITDEEAASFYMQRSEYVREYIENIYKDNFDVQKQALSLNKKIQTPFTFIYGYGGNNSADTLYLLIFLVALICMVITAPIFSTEYQTGADDILRCTKNGRGKHALVKLIASLLITGIVYIVCVSIFVLTVNTVYGWDSLQTSQQFSGLLSINSLAPLTVGGVQQITIISEFLVFLAVVCFTLFLSAKCKTPMTTMIVCAVFLVSPLVVNYLGKGNIIEWIRICLLPSGGIGLTNSFYFELAMRANFLQFGSINIWSPYAIVALAVIKVILFFWLAIHFYSRHEVSA